MSQSDGKSEKQKKPQFENEAELLEAIQAGQKKARNYFVKTYQPALRYTIKLSLKKWGLWHLPTDDIEQDTWKVFWETIHEFRYCGEGKLERRLCSIGRRLVMSEKNRGNVERKYHVPFTNGYNNEEEEYRFDKFTYRYTSDLLPEDELIEREVEKRKKILIHEALRGLKLREQKIVLRALVLNQERKAIAELYRIQLSTVQKIIQRAKAKMRASLKKYEFYEELFSEAKRHEPVKKKECRNPIEDKRRTGSYSEEENER
jgi:DNA-directed RNA polymerase specialized sigma24 family protein